MNCVLKIPLYSLVSAYFVDGPDMRWICFEPSVWQQVVEFGAGDWKTLCRLSEGFAVSMIGQPREYVAVNGGRKVRRLGRS